MSTEQSTRALNEAIRLAEYGYHLSPVLITRKDDGKKRFYFPRGWISDDAVSCDPEQVRAWWVDDPRTSFAIINGPTGTEQVDLDVKDDRNGVHWWAEHGLPDGGMVVLTPTGGRHHYWARRDDDRTLGNDSNSDTGVDVRNAKGLVIAPGGYVVGEPGSYELLTALVKPGDLPPVPDAVLDALPRAEAMKEWRADGAITYKTEAWMRERANTQLDRVELWQPGSEHGNFRHVLMGATMVCARVSDAGVSGKEETVEALLDAVRAVFGEPNLDDLTWIRQAWHDALARERWRVGAEPGGIKLERDPLLAHAPVDDEPRQETPEPEPQQEPAASGDDEARLPDWSKLPISVEWAHYKETAKREASRLADLAEAGPSKQPEITFLDDLLAEDDEEDTFRIADLWPSDGKCTLIAPSKAGKTTLVGNLLASLADGRPFLGQPEGMTGHPGFAVTPMQPGDRIVLLDFEMTRRKLRAWLRRHRIANSSAVGIELMRGQTWDIRDPEVRSTWADYLRAQNTKVLIIDPLGPILHGLGIEENSNSEVGKFLTHIDVLCREAGIPEYLVVHHAGHDGERGRGASSLRGWPDSEWMLLLEEGGKGKLPDADSVRFFRAAGRDCTVRETALSFDAATCHLSLGMGTRASVAVDKHSAPIVQLVGDHPGLGQLALVRAADDAELGIPKTTMQKVLRSLIAAGAVHTHDGENRSKHHYPGASCPSGCPSAD